MKKIFIVAESYIEFGVHMVALTEDGDCVAGHLSSNTSYGVRDMGIGTDWKHTIYNEIYGEGNWELIYIDDTQYEDAAFKDAVAKNHAKEEENTEEQE